MKQPTTKETAMQPASLLDQLDITPLHIERGRQMRSVVQHDIAHRGLSAESAVESLASYLGVEVETVRLAIAIANEADAAERA
jgi:hypothetical protein